MAKDPTGWRDQQGHIPTFYFDHVDGFVIKRDEGGIMCDSAEQARAAANLATAELIRGELPWSAERRFSVRVRSEPEANVCRSSAAIILTTKPS